MLGRLGSRLGKGGERNYKDRKSVGKGKVTKRAERFQAGYLEVFDLLRQLLVNEGGEKGCTGGKIIEIIDQVRHTTGPLIEDATVDPDIHAFCQT